MENSKLWHPRPKRRRVNNALATREWMEYGGKQVLKLEAWFSGSNSYLFIVFFPEIHQQAQEHMNYET
jgi:hypothetical protein